MNYRKLIPGRGFRLWILKFFQWVPDSIMLRFQYRIQLGRKLNLKNPKRYTEKIQLYKIQYRNPILGQCVDKYAVREYVKNKGLSSILNELYGVYDNASQIEFDKLPEKFVLKTTDGGGGNNVIICRDKSSFDINKAVKSLDSWLNIKNINAGREWAYTQMPSSRIIAEKYMESSDRLKAAKGIEDFKFFCFNGEPSYIVVDVDRYIEHKRNFYDLNWNNLNIETDCKQIDYEYEKPYNLNEMLEIARVLSKDFPAVRVDLYNIDGKIIFGELTFYPWSGYVPFIPDSFDYELGKKFQLDK